MSTTRSLEHAQVLITGGGSGIGLGLAQRYLATGARVCITGRNRERLEHAARALPGLSFIVSDIADPQARERLATQVCQTLPELTVLINNAGIQRRVSLAADDAPWSSRQTEIDTLLSGPVHLTHLLIPPMLEHGKPATVVNVTSRGAYVPQPFAPLYSACKAALHSYTVNCAMHSSTPVAAWWRSFRLQSIRTCRVRRRATVPMSMRFAMR
ncbi:Serine 3-dehydrogenase (plasmid) [Burkholderia sp. AD24]|nr:Serine 3-dehydrogenase [Burkholderia sp. AD24]